MKKFVKETAENNLTINLRLTKRKGCNIESANKTLLKKNEGDKAIRKATRVITTSPKIVMKIMIKVEIPIKIRTIGRRNIIDDTWIMTIIFFQKLN